MDKNLFVKLTFGAMIFLVFSSFANAEKLPVEIEKHIQKNMHYELNNNRRGRQYKPKLWELCKTFVSPPNPDRNIARCGNWVIEENKIADKNPEYGEALIKLDYNGDDKIDYFLAVGSLKTEKLNGNLLKYKKVQVYLFVSKKSGGFQPILIREDDTDTSFQIRGISTLSKGEDVKFRMCGGETYQESFKWFKLTHTSIVIFDKFSLAQALVPYQNKIFNGYFSRDQKDEKYLPIGRTEQPDKCSIWWYGRQNEGKPTFLNQ